MSTAAPRVPRFFETYGLAYGFGLLFLLPGILLIGSQPVYSFTLFYTVMLTIPPIAAAFLVLATDPPEKKTGSLLKKGLLLTVLATTGSLLAIFFGTPLAIFMFRYGVGHSQGLTAVVSAAGLTLVGAPMVYALVSSFRAQSWIRVIAMAAAIVAMGIVIALTTSQGGFLVESMRRDQGEIMMGLLEWCMPAFAISAAWLRRSAVV